ncbi:hypothetical protein B0H14DRAFT_537837 [Mycena olivaceomarginata]|nr:hypothetical protein B0H14DRAFT_537837 [Mycena olivaceomarginata]
MLGTLDPWHLHAAHPFLRPFHLWAGPRPPAGQSAGFLLCDLLRVPEFPPIKLCFPAHLLGCWELWIRGISMRPIRFFDHSIFGRDLGHPLANLQGSSCATQRLTVPHPHKEVGALVLLFNLPCFSNSISQLSFTIPMPALLEASKPLSILAPGLAPSSTPWAVTDALLVLIGAAGTIHYASPQHLTGVLVAAMADVKKTYLEAVENGALCASDVHIAEVFSNLQLEVSTIRQASLHSSLSHSAMLCDFLKGRTFSILRCIHQVHELGTHLEILKESQLREIASHRVATSSPTSVVGF